MTPTSAFTLQVNGRLVDLSRPCVMGILNATPDSFFAGSRKQTEHDISRRADEIVEQGGAIIDVGACSTRPGAGEVSEAEEMERLRTALAAVRRVQPDAVLSVDTFRPDVARMAVEEYGAGIVNDVSESASMFAMVARLRVAYVLMSVRPSIETMLPVLADEVRQRFAVADDPVAQESLRLPLLVGVSRKSMVYRLLDCSPDEALSGTTALHAVALAKGARVLRVHDVADAVAAVRVMEALRQYDPATGLEEQK